MAISGNVSGSVSAVVTPDICRFYGHSVASAADSVTATPSVFGIHRQRRTCVPSIGARGNYNGTIGVRSAIRTLASPRTGSCASGGTVIPGNGSCRTDSRGCRARSVYRRYARRTGSGNVIRFATRGLGAQCHDSVGTSRRGLDRTIGNRPGNVSALSVYHLRHRISQHGDGRTRRRATDGRPVDQGTGGRTARNVPYESRNETYGRNDGIISDYCRLSIG